MTAAAPSGQPSTPAEALRFYAARQPEVPEAQEWARQLSRWADELDAAPAPGPAAPAAPCGCRTADEHASVTAAFSGEPAPLPVGDWLGEEFSRAEQMMDRTPASALPVVTRGATRTAGPAAPAATHPPTTLRETTMPADPARDFAAGLHRRITAVLADLDQVDATHRCATKGGLDVCAECTSHYTRVLVSWPCPTADLVARIRRTLTEETTQ